MTRYWDRLTPQSQGALLWLWWSFAVLVVWTS